MSKPWANQTPFLVIVWRIILCSLPGKLNVEFEATGSVISKANERSTIHRQRLPYRLLSASMGMYIIYILYGASAVVVSVPGNHDALGTNNPHGVLTAGIHVVSPDSSGT